MSLDKATRQRSELLDHPSYIFCLEIGICKLNAFAQIFPTEKMTIATSEATSVIEASYSKEKIINNLHFGKTGVSSGYFEIIRGSLMRP